MNLQKPDAPEQGWEREEVEAPAAKTALVSQNDRYDSPNHAMVSAAGEILSSMTQAEAEILIVAKDSLEAAVWDRDLQLADAFARNEQLTKTISLLTSFSAELALTLEQRNEEYHIALRRLAGVLAAPENAWEASRYALLPGGVQPAAQTGDELNALTKQIDSLKSALSASEQAKVEIEDRLNVRDVAMSDLVAAVEPLRERLEELAAENEDLCARLAERSAEFKGLQQEAVLLQADLDALAAREAEFRSLSDELAAVQEQALADSSVTINDLREQIEAVKDSLASQAQEHQTEVDELTGQLTAALSAGAAEANSRADSLHAQLDALAASSADLQARLGQRDADHALLSEQLDRARAALESVRAEKTMLEANLRSASDSHSALSDRLAEARRELTAAYSEKEAAQKQLASRQAEVETMRTRLREAVVQLAEAPSDLSARGAVSNRLVSKRAPVASALIAGAQPELSSLPQDLSKIDGIGSVSERRLFAAGIGTFWEVSSLGNADLERVLGLKGTRRQTFPYDAVRASALKLSQESDTVGLIWEGQPIDDFEAITGMGIACQRKLYLAGVFTFAALAALAEEQLAAICKATRQNKPDYASWIEQAQQLAEREP